MEYKTSDKLKEEYSKALENVARANQELLAVEKKILSATNLPASNTYKVTAKIKGQKKETTAYLYAKGIVPASGNVNLYFRAGKNNRDGIYVVDVHEKVNK